MIAKGRDAHIAFVCLVMVSTGCGPGKHYRQGRAAEKRGAVHVAYDEYCLAARDRPSTAALASAIQRVAPTAATYWHARAKIAEAQGRTKDAVELSLRCLSIKPDHDAALEDVRSLRGGDESTPARTGGKRRIRRNPARSLPPVPPKADKPPAPPRASPRPPRPTTHVAKQHKPSRSRPAPSTGVMAAGPSRSPPPTPTPQPPPPEDDGYLTVKTPGEHKRPPAARRHAVADVFVELVKVDETVVSLDLYDGDRRIQEIRDLRIGRSKLFRSRSRRWYRLTVISAHQRTGSVRIGIEPA